MILAAFGDFLRFHLLLYTAVNSFSVVRVSVCGSWRGGGGGGGMGVESP